MESEKSFELQTVARSLLSQSWSVECPCCCVANCCSIVAVQELQCCVSLLLCYKLLLDRCCPRVAVLSVLVAVFQTVARSLLSKSCSVDRFLWRCCKLLLDRCCPRVAVLTGSCGGVANCMCSIVAVPELQC